jgi:steroid delta-isomerase-like uncharacterized protein
VILPVFKTGERQGSCRWCVRLAHASAIFSRAITDSSSCATHPTRCLYNDLLLGVRMKPRIATAVAVLLSVCCVAATSSRNKSTDLVQKNFAAWNAHDADRVASLYTDDVIYEDVAFGLTARGHAEMRKMAADFFASVPDLKLEVVSSTSMGNHGSVEWVFSGTDVGLFKTGKKFSVRGASVYELRGQKFSANRDYYDSASLMRQVGVLPKASQ